VMDECECVGKGWVVAPGEGKAGSFSICSEGFWAFGIAEPTPVDIEKRA